MSEFSERLKIEMSKHGYNLTEFSAATEIGVPHLCHILQGDRNPSFETLRDLVKALPKTNARKLLLGD